MSSVQNKNIRVISKQDESFYFSVHIHQELMYDYECTNDGVKLKMKS